MQAALTVVGTGIRWGTDLAANARGQIEEADEVFFLASDSISRAVLRNLRPDAISLSELYGHDLERSVTYERMVERVLAAVRAGRRVCFAIPGHPGVFAQPTHEAIRRARAEGYTAAMLPALSAADHLYADLGVDPGEPGSVNFDATDFLIHGRTADPSAVLILWQIGAIGESRNPRAVNMNGVRLLAEVLLESYPPSHGVTVYEASRYVICEPVILHTPLEGLPALDIPLAATLYVPPARSPELVAERLASLGLPNATASRREHLGRA